MLLKKIGSPKKMSAAKSKAKPHVVLAPCVQEFPKDSVEVKVEPVAFEIGSDSDVVVETDSPSVHPDERTTISLRNMRRLFWMILTL